jgi:hypothetical protein
MKTCSHFWQYLAEFFLEWEMFQIKVIEKNKTHILCSLTFFLEYLAVYEIISKNIVELERPQTIWRLRVAYGIIKPTRAQAHACARTPTHLHIHTELCNSSCFSAATIVTWTRLSVSATYIVCRALLVAVCLCSANLCLEPRFTFHFRV